MDCKHPFTVPRFFLFIRWMSKSTRWKLSIVLTWRTNLMSFGQYVRFRPILDHILTFKVIFNKIIQKNQKCVPFTAPEDRLEEFEFEKSNNNMACGALNFSPKFIFGCKIRYFLYIKVIYLYITFFICWLFYVVNFGLFHLSVDIFWAKTIAKGNVYLNHKKRYLKPCCFKKLIVKWKIWYSQTSYVVYSRKKHRNFLQGGSWMSKIQIRWTIFFVEINQMLFAFMYFKWTKIDSLNFFLKKKTKTVICRIGGVYITDIVK